MSADTNVKSISKIAKWTGRIISAVPVLFMGVGGLVALIDPALVIKMFNALGYASSLVRPIALVELACVVVYLVPRTNILGAILLTAYLGGATASHVRAGQPFYLPVAVGVLVWLGLYLRDLNVRALIPWRNRTTAGLPEPGHD